MVERSFGFAMCVMPSAQPGSFVMADPFTLKPLPWAEDALAPTISARTISFHYHKHHKAYVDTLNKLVQGTRYTQMPLEQVARATVNGKDKDQQIFNNAGQVWNHDFFWRSLM